MDADRSDALQEAVRTAWERRTPLRIRGGDSKGFYGRAASGEPLDVAGHRGVLRYEPSELILTARAGTPLDEVEETLRASGQMLPFEPPRYAPGATLGGTVACALAGPRRPYAGAVRDFLLGVRCINGEGKRVRFGGEVVKNVAGFDGFRLMAGALGTLGVLLELSFKVLPRPAHERTLVFERDAGAAIADMNRWARRPLPLGATAHDGRHLRVRLEGSEAGVEAAAAELGGDTDPDGAAFWESVREHGHPWFAGTEPLWRLALPPATPPLPIVGTWFIEWGGGQRWLRTMLAPKFIREMAARSGGHACLFRGGARDGEVFHPLPDALMDVHRRLKSAFDPRGILNPRRMYREI